MKVIKLITALTICFSLTFGVIDVTPERSAQAADTITKTITPYLSDGARADSAELKKLTIDGYYQGTEFVFTTTKTISFTVTFDSGFKYNNEFTSFFNGNSRASRTNLANNKYRFSFSAVKGERIALSALDDIWITTTPDKLPLIEISNITMQSMDKINWRGARLKLTKGSKNYFSSNFEGKMDIKGRGNSFWYVPKKSFSILFDEKVSLLDIPATRKYALIANYYDATQVRNYLTYKTGLDLDGIGYTPKCEFVQLKFNNVDYGVYLLVERISLEKTKIDIPEANKDSITGGYLIEKDVLSKIADDEHDFPCPYDTTLENDTDVFNLKDPDEPTEAMKTYLTDYMQRVHDAIMGESNESYKKYVDMPTWADFIIMQEVTKNVDGNMKTSCYMYKAPNDEKLYFTGLWDFDNAYGRANYNHNNHAKSGWDSPYPTTPNGFMVINSSSPWFKAMYSQPEFEKLIKSQYSKYRDTMLSDMHRTIDVASAYISTAKAAEAPNLSDDNMNSTPDKLKTWLTQRFTWLDSQWYDPVDKLTIKKPNKTTYNVGESFNPAGMTITVHRASGVTHTTIDYKLNSLDTSTVGNKTLAIEYGGKVVILSVTVAVPATATKIPSSTITGTSTLLPSTNSSYTNTTIGPSDTSLITESPISSTTTSVDPANTITQNLTGDATTAPGMTPTPSASISNSDNDTPRSANSSKSIPIWLYILIPTVLALAALFYVYYMRKRQK